MKWAGHIVQMGGFALGAEKSLNTPPSYITSIPGFESQDKLLKEYSKWNCEILNEISFKEKMDIVITNPPCSGLSTMTSSAYVSPDEREKKIKFIKHVVEDIITLYEPEVIIGENSSNMFSKSGDKITNDLLEICDKNGYSLSYYKTNSIYHQGAQNRVRNFFFLWKGSQVPLMENIDNGSTNFEDYLNNVSGLQGSELMIVPNLTNNYIYKYMKYLNLDIRKELSIHTDCYNWAINNNKIDDIIKYYENDKNTDEYKKSIRLKNKKENDESIWHNYPCFYQKITPPIITKTLRRTLHPFEDRGLSIREAMRLMGFPDDYSFPLKSKFKLITKNVPVNTAKDMVSIAKDMVSIAKDFINKKLILKSVKFDKFDNTNEKIERDCDDW